MSVGSLWLGCLSAEQLSRQGQSTTGSSWPAPKGMRNARWGGGMWHVRHQGGPVGFRTTTRSDIPVPLGLPKESNCWDAAGKHVANDMQLTPAMTDLHESSAACMAVTGWQGRLCQMHCHLLGAIKLNQEATPCIQCSFHMAVLSPAAATADRQTGPQTHV